MLNSKFLKKIAVPMLAIMIICSHILLVKITYLTKWKGGGFGMYSEVHYYYNSIYIPNFGGSLDSLSANNSNLKASVMDLKRMPNASNFKKLAEHISKLTKDDTLKIQVWRPLIDAKTSTYSRELINQFEYIKP